MATKNRRNGKTRVRRVLNFRMGPPKPRRTMPFVTIFHWHGKTFFGFLGSQDEGGLNSIAHWRFGEPPLPISLARAKQQRDELNRADAIPHPLRRTARC